MVTAFQSSPGGSSKSPMERPPERAHRACEKCTRTKKKCDKALPECSRCQRLASECSYDYIFTAPTTAIVDPGTQGSAGSPHDYMTGMARFNIFDTDLELPSAMIMNLFNAKGFSWHEAVSLYFRTTNMWLSAVHEQRFRQKLERLDRNGLPREPEMALLVVCMHLVTQHADSGRPVMPDGKEMLSLPAYVVAKRVFSILRGLGAPSIEIVQSATLLCLYEFGHGDFPRAYVTVGDAYTTAASMGIRPGKYRETERDWAVPPEDEEKWDLYWAMLIVDRLIRFERRLMWKEFHVPSPVEDDLLPTTNYVWNEQTGSPVRVVQRHPAGISPSVPLGAFQRNCQCAILSTRALVWQTETYNSGRPPSVASFAELDVATRSLVEAMVLQASTWGEYYECFATCTCLLLLLYCSYLCTIRPSEIYTNTNNLEVLKAIAGINFTIRIIADTTRDLNQHLARQPEMLATCSPVTPYSAYHSLAALSNFEHVIWEADTRFHDIYSTLHFFAKRWGVAGQLVKRIEEFLGTKDEEGAPLLDFSFLSRT